MEKMVKYRLEVNYYTVDYEDKMCETSSPIYSLEQGLHEYAEAIRKTCIDDRSRPARVHLWEYGWIGEPWKHESKMEPITIAKNY